MLGLETPARGEVRVFGRNLHEGDHEELRELRSRWGVLFQEGALFSALSVFDNVALPLVIRGFAHDAIGRRVRAALDSVGLLGQERLLGLLVAALTPVQTSDEVRSSQGQGVARAEHTSSCLQGARQHRLCIFETTRNHVHPTEAAHRREGFGVVVSV